MDLRGKKILIVGLARSGLAAAEFCAHEGAYVTVNDSQSEDKFAREIERLQKFPVTFIFGSHPEKIFSETDLVVISPGVPLNIPALEAARKKGVPIISELELAFPFIKGDIIGITGTNGKSTTTTLIGELLRATGKKVWVGGNLGDPLIGGIEEARYADYVVIELSSYQLEISPSLHPKIAILLNITPDHLDRYGSYESYVRAKALVGRNQNEGDYIIFNGDDAVASEVSTHFKSHKLAFSLTRNIDTGASYNGKILTIRAKWLAAPISIDTSKSPLLGVHNMENIAAGCLAGAICGMSPEKMEEVLKNFRGLHHRLEFVRDLDGVKYYNDSKGTNVGAVVRSVESFADPIILIAGGQDKNTGYAELRPVVRDRVRSIVVIGEAAGRISNELGDVVTITRAESLKAAVEEARKLATRGDVVLLSPACASFDMFKNYVERGELFVKFVNELM